MFKQFTSCVVPMFRGFFLDDFSSPSLYVSVGGGGNLGIVGGSTTLDVVCVSKNLFSKSFLFFFCFNKLY